MTEEEMWQAVAACDKTYDGKFFYGVKTTGIFCRPSCNSRVPLRKNVVFFQTAEDAIKAGFRPCKRCRPELLSYTPLLDLAADMKKLLDLYYAQQAELMERVRALGTSEKHLTEIFHNAYGISPKEYLTRLRLEKAKVCLQQGMTAGETAFAIGMESESGFYSFFKQQTGVSPKGFLATLQEGSAVLYYDSPVGRMELEASQGKLCKATLLDGTVMEHASDPASLEVVKAAKAQLEEYFAHKRKVFDLPLLLKGTPFQKLVWQALQQIPYGETRTYGNIAAAIHKLKAARAVGMANHNNHIIIIVPCHRVIGKSGSLTGYAGGVDVKEYLLELEQGARK